MVPEHCPRTLTFKIDIEVYSNIFYCSTPKQFFVNRNLCIEKTELLDSWRYQIVCIPKSVSVGCSDSENLTWTGNDNAPVGESTDQGTRLPPNGVRIRNIWHIFDKRPTCSEYFSRSTQGPQRLPESKYIDRHITNCRLEDPRWTHHFDCRPSWYSVWHASSIQGLQKSQF